MPLVKVIRQGIIQKSTRVPTSTCAVILPMTLGHIRNEATSEHEEFSKVESLSDAFEIFKPAFHFRGSAGVDEIEFHAELVFRSIKDFDPESLQRKQEVRDRDGQVIYLRNDIADLKNNIDLLYRLKDRWKLPAIRRAWANEIQRKEIIEALRQLHAEVEKISRQEASEGQTPNLIVAKSQNPHLLQEILADLHPALIDGCKEFSQVFMPQSAQEFISQLSNFNILLSERDSYETTLKKLQLQIDRVESMRDQLLGQIFAVIRPMEISYREVMLFFENSRASSGEIVKPVELFILNADPQAMQDIFSITIAALENFVRKRNDNFNFRDDICNIVVPGYLPQHVREKVEDIANAWGMLFIGDLDDERTFRNIERNFLPGGKYEFLRRAEDRAAADVCIIGYLQLRPCHWFESINGSDEGLYGPPSLIFAGAIARSDNTHGLAQGPVGSRFGRIIGAQKCRVEPLIGEMEYLSMERQLIPIVRDGSNQLCFFGCRTQADDPFGVLKFFTSYRILRYLERCCRHYLLQIAGQVLTREFMDEQIEAPLKRLMDDQVEQGTIVGYDLFVDKDHNKRMQGICDITLNVMPAGPAETYVLKIDVPEFKANLAPYPE